MTRVCGAWSLKNNTWQPLVLIKPQQPSPEHKNPWPATGKMWFGAATRNAARATQKRSAGLHIRLRDLPLAASIIWRRPAHSCYLSPKRVLHLTAWPTVEAPTQLSMSLPAGSRGGLVCLQRQKLPRFSILLTIFLLWGFHIFLPPLCGREKEDKGEAHMEVRVKINTPDLSWTEFHPNCSAHSHSILMHPRPPENTRDHYYKSTVCDSPRLIEPVWENCSPRGAAGGQKCLERW